MLSKDAHAKAADRVGRTLSGKYTLDSLIGLGGMAAVYAATHRNGSRAALKVLHAELSRAGEVRTRFLREGYVANKVGHPGVVRVLDDDVTEDDCAYIVMELLEGETLDARRQRVGGKLSVAEAIAHAARILDVLAAAHAQGIVHRDIKPDNVFLQGDGSLKVMDFGIARLRDGTSLTRSGALMGTPGFMPPEQAAGRNKDVDERSDVWALGALLFVMLTSEEVHRARTSQEQMIYAATQSARPIRSAMPDLSEEVASVVDRALQFEMGNRWPSASAMRNALAQAAQSIGLGLEPVRPRLEIVTEEASPPEFTPTLSTAGATLILGSVRSDDPKTE